MENIVIGIEGLVGSGKTSICRDLLQRDESYVLLNLLLSKMLQSILHI